MPGLEVPGLNRVPPPQRSTRCVCVCVLRGTAVRFVPRSRFWRIERPVLVNSPPDTQGGLDRGSLGGPARSGHGRECRLTGGLAA